MNERRVASDRRKGDRRQEVGPDTAVIRRLRVYVSGQELPTVTYSTAPTYWAGWKR